jgi:hypothetical protein
MPVLLKGDGTYVFFFSIHLFYLFVVMRFCLFCFFFVIFHDRF